VETKPVLVGSDFQQLYSWRPFMCGAGHNQSLASPFQQAVRNIQQARRDPSLLGRVAHSSRITGDVMWT